jgi:nicotinamide-nucleotide amidase
VVTVGDELLLGETVDSNAAWLGRGLSELGFDVVRRYTVGDVAGEIRHALRGGLEVADLVLFTGGLGPTRDDLTRPVVAEALEAPLALDQDILADLRERFRRHGYPDLPEANVSQARVPRGAVLLPNPRGTAPGLLMDAPRDRVVALLPGVPAEMKGIFLEELGPRLEGRFGPRLRPVQHVTLRTTGISESDLAGRVRDALPPEGDPVTVAFLPDVTGVDLRLTVRGAADRQEARRALDRVERALTEIVEPYLYRAPETGDLVEAVSRELRRRGRTLAVAESCTGGLIARRMTDVPGSSEIFVGGIVAYADAVKGALLGVDDDTLAEDGAVSESVARAMALGVARRLGAKCGIGVTGIAGPGGGTEEKPVGLVWFAASVDDRVEARSRVFPGDRDAVRRRSAQAALALLHRLLREDASVVDGVVL